MTTTTTTTTKIIREVTVVKMRTRMRNLLAAVTMTKRKAMVMLHPRQHKDYFVTKCDLFTTLLLPCIADSKGGQWDCPGGS
jgi:hypothetical protein